MNAKDYNLIPSENGNHEFCIMKIEEKAHPEWAATYPEPICRLCMNPYSLYLDSDRQECPSPLAGKSK